MAFIQGQEDDELYGQQGQAGSGQVPLVGQGTTAVSQGGVGGQSGPAGAGGGGGWTNIQNYLKANEGDTGSSQALNKTVGSQFDKEKDAYTNDSGMFLKSAYDQVDKTNISNEDAENTIKTSGASYNWDGNQNEDYQKNVEKFQNALTGQYSGPKEYTYGFNAQTQNYGDQLNDSKGFDSLMGGLYNKGAGRPLTSGQFQLQKQFDTNSEPLANVRESLKGKYSDLTSDRDAVVKNTTEALGGVEKQYRTNQNRLKDFLGAKSNEYEQQIGQAEAAAKNEYGQLYNTGQTGNASIGYNMMNNTRGANPAMGTRQAAGIYGGNLTWDQLQRENDTVIDSYLMHPGGGKISWVGAQPDLDARRGQLGQFYGEQNAKYGQTADEQERWFNTLQDFLKSDVERKKQGFNVTGR